MSAMFEYLEWRGDLSFSADKFNEVDAAMLSMLSYIDFGSLSGNKSITMKDAALKYCPDGKYDSVRLGLILPSKKINKLFCMTGETRRFGNVEVSDYESTTSEKDNCQFAAMTFHLSNKNMVIVFRGTDDSIVGWKEDCCLAFLDEIPAQRMAVDYVSRMAEKYPEKRMYLTGHSKGGNLGMYCAVRSCEEIRDKIIRVISCDGPGLGKNTVSSPEFKSMQRKISALVPQSSFIGTLFDMDMRYVVVRGKVQGAFQHDSFTWDIMGNSFVHLPSLSNRGKKNVEQFKQSMNRMSLDEKKEFVNTFFSIIESTGAKTLTEFKNKGIRNTLTLIRNYSGLDKQKRELMLGLTLKLFDLKQEKSKTE